MGPSSIVTEKSGSQGNSTRLTVIKIVDSLEDLMGPL